MAYTINRTDGSIFAVVPDGQIDTTTSLVLVGKNYSGYGEFLNENLFRLLENHANATQPTAPILGQLWYDKTTNILKVWNGSQFRSLGGATTSTTAPTGNNNGDFWWDSANKQLKVWDSSTNSFTIIGPLTTSGTGQTGSIPEIIQDASAQDKVIVKLIVQDVVVGIISKSATFTPNPAIAGFSTIQPGINMATGYQLVGTATNAVALDGIDSTGYIQTALTSGQTVGGDFTAAGKIMAGPAGQFKATYASNNVTLENAGTGSIILKTTGAASAMTIATSGAITTSGSLTVGGTFSAASLGGNGSSITTLNASNLTTGTVPDARLNGSYTSFTNVTGTGTATFANLVGNGSGITALNASNLASGIIPDDRISGNYSGLGHLTPTANATSNLGSTSLRWNTIYGVEFNGTATSALYADLAERFDADADYQPGTVVRLGGSKEITQENESCSADVFGVISTDPAYLMNNKTTGLPVALIGRVPVRALGIIKKNDRLVSAGNGCVRAALPGEVTPFNYIGRALEDKLSTGESLIEAFVTAK